MSLYSKTITLGHLPRITLLVIGCCLAQLAWAQASAPLPPQVVTHDPALLTPQDDSDDDAGVTITPDDRSTRIRTYGVGGRATREEVDPGVLPNYSVSPEADTQSVIPDSDPVRGDAVQPPMWTIWSW